MFLLLSLPLPQRTTFPLLIMFFSLQLPKPPLEPPTTTPIHQRYTSNIPPLSVTQISLCNNTSNSPDRRRPLLACPPSTIRIQEAVREGECATGREGRCAATAVQRSTIE